jgi:hypothetical protein
MASLPALRRPKRAVHPTAADLTAQVDTKLTLARRLRAEDLARRTTSVAPPAGSR